MTPRLRRALPIAAALALIALAAGLRLWELELRPPHHDEGVNGWFAEGVVRNGHYDYDPTNFHGPSYFYLLAGSREVAGFGLWQLRLPGALIGLASCFVPLLLRRRLGWTAALAACAVLATSPTLVYFARYAIHETLLAALGLVAAACVLRWTEHGRSGWLAGAAAAIALMIATKETAVLFLAVAGVWLLGETAVESVRARHLVVLGRRAAWSWRVPAIALGLVALIAAIHVVAFTGAFQSKGTLGSQLQRSIDAYLVWMKTGTGHAGHGKDACYYLHLATRYELVLYLLAAAGTVGGFARRELRGLGLVGFGLLAAYSAISYKMPWLPVSWLMLLAIPAGHGAVLVIRTVREELFGRAPAAAVVAVLLIPALAITVRSSFVRPADARESFAYVHTDDDYNTWFGYIEQGARAVGIRNLTISVDHDARWPLAWSLLPYRLTRWQARGSEHVMIVAASRAAAVEARVVEAYLRREYQLRNGAEPAIIYLRRRTFAPLLGAAAAGFTAVEPAARPPAAVARR